MNHTDPRDCEPADLRETKQCFSGAPGKLHTLLSDISTIKEEKYISKGYTYSETVGVEEIKGNDIDPQNYYQSYVDGGDYQDEVPVEYDEHETIKSLTEKLMSLVQDLEGKLNLGRVSKDFKLKVRYVRLCLVVLQIHDDFDHPNRENSNACYREAGNRAKHFEWEFSVSDADCDFKLWQEVETLLENIKSQIITQSIWWDDNDIAPFFENLCHSMKMGIIEVCQAVAMLQVTEHHNLNVMLGPENCQENFWDAIQAAVEFGIISDEEEIGLLEFINMVGTAAKHAFFEPYEEY